MIRLRRLARGLVGATLLASPSIAVGSPQQSRPAIRIQDARITALARVNGKVVHEELEKEHGRWIYSFEIRPTGARGKLIKEINIDANTGAVVGVETEHE